MAKVRRGEDRIEELKDALCLESKERYELALDNQVLVQENQELEISIEELKDDYERRIRELTPRTLSKDWSKKGAWPNWVIQLIIELLSHRTPPSCVSANILSVISLVCPELIETSKYHFVYLLFHVHCCHSN